MVRLRFLTPLSLLSLLELSLVLGACGDNPATSSPTPNLSTTSVAAPTVAATTAPLTTLPITTVFPTSIVSATLTGVTTPAATNSPLMLVRKIDISANVKVPTGMVLDKQGNFYVADALQNTINKFDPSGRLLTQWGKKGSGDGEFNLSRNQAPLQYSGYIAIDPTGNIYVPDTYNHRIEKFDSSGKLLAKWGSEGSDDGQFHEPAQIVLDSQNNLYVSDLNVKDASGRVQKFDASGKFLTSYHNEGSGDGQFMVGFVAAVDKQDNFYMADVMNSRVQVFDSNLRFVRNIGNYGNGDGQFNEPTSALAMDSKGNLYAGDGKSTTSSRIQIFSRVGKFLGQWSVPSSEPRFNFLCALAIDSNDNIYLTRGPDASVIYQFQVKF